MRKMVVRPLHFAQFCVFSNICDEAHKHETKKNHIFEGGGMEAEMGLKKKDFPENVFVFPFRMIWMGSN